MKKTKKQKKSKNCSTTLLVTKKTRRSPSSWMNALTLPQLLSWFCRRKSIPRAHPLSSRKTRSTSFSASSSLRNTQQRTLPNKRKLLCPKRVSSPSRAKSNLRPAANSRNRPQAKNRPRPKSLKSSSLTMILMNTASPSQISKWFTTLLTRMMILKSIPSSIWTSEKLRPPLRRVQVKISLKSSCKSHRLAKWDSSLLWLTNRSLMKMRRQLPWTSHVEGLQPKDQAAPPSKKHLLRRRKSNQP